MIIENYRKYIDFFNKFNLCDTYYNKYEYLRIIFENKLNEIKYFEEEQNIFKEFEIIHKKYIPIKDNYYILIDYNLIIIVKDISEPNQKECNFKVLFKRKFDKRDFLYYRRQLIFKDILKLEEKLSFYNGNNY